MKRLDLLIIVVLLLVAGAIATIFMTVNKDNGSAVEISVSGKLAQKFSLSDGEQKVQINGTIGTLVVCVDSDGVYVSEADCPSQDCVEVGKIKSPKESIACLPNQVLIKITGDGTLETEVDAIAK